MRRDGARPDEVTQPRHPLVVALVGGVVIVLDAKNGTS